MSNPRLPAELLDHVVDFLHDTKYALRSCCLVSKLWIPRTRMHLFADVTFLAETRLESWKETFPDPSTSPAHYTKTLFIDCLLVTVSDAEAGGWIRSFSRVMHLKMLALGIGCTSASWRSLYHISQIFTCHQIPLRDSSHPSVFAGFRSHPFIPTSQGLSCAHRQRGDRR